MSDSGKCMTNDPAFLEALRRDMLKFARLQLRDDALAEDTVQEALASAFASDNFAGRSAVKTWVFAILRNKIIDQIRVRNRSINVSSLSAEEESMDQAFESLFSSSDRWSHAAMPSDWGNPEDSLRQKHFWEVFEACLNHLPENTARVFMMREFLEFETAEVCKELSITVSNCNVILHRARNGLRRCLENGWFLPGEQRC